MKTTRYLHSHFEWLKLSYSSIRILLDVCLAAHSWSFLDGLPKMSNCYCLPGRAGGTPRWIRCRLEDKTMLGEVPALSLSHSRVHPTIDNIGEQIHQDI